MIVSHCVARVYSALITAFIAATFSLAATAAFAQVGVITTVDPGGGGAGTVEATPDGQKVYVTNIPSSGVSVIDTATKTLQTVYSAGSVVQDIALSPNGAELWASNRAAGTISVIDTSTDAIVDTISLSIGLVQDIAFAPDGTLAYVTSGNVSGAINVAVVDTATRTTVDTIPFTDPLGPLVISPDGQTAYVSLHIGPQPWTYQTAVVDVGTKQVLSTIADLWLVDVSSDGATGWGWRQSQNTVYANDTVFEVDLLTNAVANQINIDPLPRGLVRDPDTDQIYVASRLSEKINIIDAGLTTIEQTVDVVGGPNAIALTPDGLEAYVANNDAGTVDVVSLAGNKINTVFFVDDFNRPDSDEPGNGWLRSSNNHPDPNDTLELLNNEITSTCADVGCYNGMHRPGPSFDGPVKIQATLKETLANPPGGGGSSYDSHFFIRSSGSARFPGSGYGVIVTRTGGQDSRARFIDDGVILQEVSSTVGQFGPELDVSVVFNPDGSILVEIVGLETGNVFEFAFPPRAIASTGPYLGYTHGHRDPRAPAPPTGVDPRMDDYVVSIFVDNDPPTADPGGPQSVHAGDTVFLDGSDSFDDNTDTVDLIYAWSFVSKPASSAAVLTGANTITPSFVADVQGTYEVGLIVTDEGGLPSTQKVVTVSSDNLAPNVVATGPDLAVIGDVVNLDGSQSMDPDGDPITFGWTINSAPAGSIAVLSGANTAFASFVPDLAGTYDILLIVSDLIGPGDPASVQVVADTAEGVAETVIIDVSDDVDALPPDGVTNGGNQNALGNFLSQAMVAIQEGDIAEAISKLEQARERTDGCVLRGSADGAGPGRDWVTDDPDCSAQIEAYNEITTALNALLGI